MIPKAEIERLWWLGGTPTRICKILSLSSRHYFYELRAYCKTLGSSPERDDYIFRQRSEGVYHPDLYLGPSYTNKSKLQPIPLWIKSVIDEKYAKYGEYPYAQRTAGDQEYMNSLVRGNDAKRSGKGRGRNPLQRRDV